MVSADLVGDCGAEGYTCRGHQRLNSEIGQFMKAPDVQERLSSLGLIPLHSTPERVMELVKTGSVRMAQVVKAAGIQPE